MAKNVASKFPLDLELHLLLIVAVRLGVVLPRAVDRDRQAAWTSPTAGLRQMMTRNKLQKILPHET